MGKAVDIVSKDINMQDTWRKIVAKHVALVNCF
jgi:hypothetical protein